MHPGMKRALLGAHNVAHEPIYDAQELEHISPGHRNAQVRYIPNFKSGRSPSGQRCVMHSFDISRSLSVVVASVAR
eukprot:9111134-Pyramimonas_sp.AAC.1